MDEDENISCCGMDCNKCSLYELCAGCNAVCGKVFHAPKGKECPIYYCSRIKNGFQTCGQCDQFPCHIILNTKDPELTDEEFMQSVEERAARLKRK